MQGLVYGGLSVERKARINFCGDLAGDDLEDFLAKLHQEVVQCGVNLLLDVAAVLLAILDSRVNQLLVLGLLGRGEDERGVGGRILWLILVDGRKVTRVTDDSLQQLLLALFHSDCDAARRCRWHLRLLRWGLA